MNSKPTMDVGPFSPDYLYGWLYVALSTPRTWREHAQDLRMLRAMALLAGAYF